MTSYQPLLFPMDQPVALDTNTVHIYSITMRAIRLRVNYRLDIYIQGDNTQIGVRLRNGDFRYLPWGGFVEESLEGIGRPVKLKVDAYTLNNSWNAEWTELTSREFLLGSVYEQRAYAIVPFRVI
ncbi:MAG: hypothetical protein QGI68_16610 [Pseudomonadales bacterium]|jgi:hypothetical protein|nr:hypothetical protein [Pseudomonadales bacterium]|tara:strand:- start:162 stop:536 length:375 start_codon:yes stop_codon:yes gene_type:complete